MVVVRTAVEARMVVVVDFMEAEVGAVTVAVGDVLATGATTTTTVAAGAVDGIIRTVATTIRRIMIPILHPPTLFKFPFRPPHQ